MPLKQPPHLSHMGEQQGDVQAVIAKIEDKTYEWLKEQQQKEVSLCKWTWQYISIKLQFSSLHLGKTDK